MGIVLDAKKEISAKRCAVLRRVCLCCLSIAVIALVANLGISAQAKQQTLAEVLASSSIKPEPKSVADLDRAITSYAVWEDCYTYLIAYYWNLPSGMLEDPLRVLTLDRRTGEWKSAQFMLNSDQIGHGECVGSVLQVHTLPDTFLLDTHINPSAGCLLILRRNLEFRNALYGWYLAAFADGLIVFQRSELHFAAVHPTELAIYDLKSDRETPLFPRKPFPRIRSDFVAKVDEFYDTHEEWCTKNNDPCDSGSVDSSLVGEVVVNDHEHALAFVISYERIQEFPGPVQKPAGPDGVVYVYRHVNAEAQMEYREMLRSAVEARFGKRSLSSLLTPPVLQQIFAK